MEKLFEKTISQKHIFKGPVVELSQDTVLLENNEEALRDVINHPGGVCIVPVDDDKNVYMVRQFRYPVRDVLEECPAGKLNFGEDPLTCGKRELQEEIGATADSYISLGQLLPTPAYCNEVIHLYLAQGLHFSEQNLDDDEFLEVYKQPLDTLIKRVLNNEIKDAKTQIALLKAKEILK